MIFLSPQQGPGLKSLPPVLTNTLMHTLVYKNRIKSFFAALYALAILPVNPVNANDSIGNDQVTVAVQKDDAGQRRFGLGVGLMRLSLNNSADDATGLDSSASGFELYSSYDLNSFVRFGLNYQQAIIDDQNTFSTIAIDDDGFIEIVDSDTTARMWSISLLLKSSSRKRGIEYGLGAGYSSLEIERKIRRCDSCQIESLSLDGGPFMFGNLELTGSQNSTLGISLRHYLSGELENSLLFRWTYISRD